MSQAIAASTITGTLTPRPPCDFAKTLAFLRGFSPTAGEQTLAGDSVTKAVTLHGRAIAFTVRGSGTADAPQISYQLLSERPIGDDEHAIIADRIRFFLSLDDDLAPFYALGQADPAFAPIIARFYGLHHPKFLTPFEIACWAILAQRIPMPIAHRVKLSLVERWGTNITLPDGIYRAFPEPDQLAQVSRPDLLSVVRNERKVDYLRAVIAFFQEIDEQFLREGEYAQVAARIRGIKGIGEWSAHFILVRGLGRMEQVNATDRELAKAAAAIYNAGKPLPTGDLQQIIDHYGPTQGYWAYYARIAAMSQMPVTEM
jgi:DNA-3-methyladenine glycosylase II